MPWNSILKICFCGACKGSSRRNDWSNSQIGDLNGNIGNLEIAYPYDYMREYNERPKPRVKVDTVTYNATPNTPRKPKVNFKIFIE